MDKIEVTQADRTLYHQLLSLGSVNLNRRRMGLPIVDGFELIAAHRLATRTDATPVAWMPIESAPKDGTVVLFATPEPGDWRYHMSRADDRWNGAYWLNKATHWMHLPAAPRGE